MQLTPRYLVDNFTYVISSETGFVVEYRPVYSRQLKVYRGIDNKLQFRLLNADQKPVFIEDTPIFVAFDENNNLVIEHPCTVTDDSSTALKGMFEVTITENDLLNIRQQYLTYNIYLNGDTKTLTYADRNFDSAGIIYVNGNSFPGVKASKVVNNWQFENDLYYGTLDENGERISAEPGVNGNEALHTIAVYSNGYVGDLIVQATLDNSLSTHDWADVTTVTFTGNETEPTPVNFNGVYSFLRFVASDNTIEKILVRN
jgi:hypothetical protein